MIRYRAGNSARSRRRLICRFSEEVDTVEVRREEFNLCFPDSESLSNFIKVTGLHVHKIAETMGDVITISEHSENPWG
jgi:hypothetical protein